MLRTLVSFRALVLVFGLVAVGLPVALVWQLGIVRTLLANNRDLSEIREGQLASAAVLQYQTDEESGIRGYAHSHQEAFLQQYRAAKIAMPARLDDLNARLSAAGTTGFDQHLVDDLRAANAEWLRVVAEPVAKGAPLDDPRAIRGKVLIDRFRDDLIPIDQRLDLRYNDAIQLRDRLTRTTSIASLAAIGVIGLEILVFGAVAAGMRRALDRERAVVEALQSATAGRLVPPRHLAIGTAYRSATRGARVGGDVYDVYRLDDARTLALVADISGKGVTAAVETTFVRYAVRALASEGLGPAEIVRRFDTLYRDANAAPEAFVSLFVGIHDRRDESVQYTNAGHEACWIRRGDELTMLAPTGPIVGLGGVPFDDARVALPQGDLLILATDGLTEARAPRGGFVPSELVTGWLMQADASHPQRFVNDVVARVARYARGRISDDLAILAISPLR